MTDHASASTKLTIDNSGGVESWISQLEKCKILSVYDLSSLCSSAKQVLIQEPTLKHVSSPVTVCGDIHGQQPDLKELFQIAGKIPDTNFLFMGDYVDKRFYSIETVCWLLALKIRYPCRVTILRGNHECRNVTQVYGFYDECLNKYTGMGSKVWSLLTDVFDYLPLLAVIDNDIICMHGGLSPSLPHLNSLNTIDRFQETPHEGPMADIMWSDPEEITGWGLSGRSCGYLWGRDTTSNFVHSNQLKLVCRAHQLVMDGYTWCHDKQVLTVFSAPNYCYRCGNQAAFMNVHSTDELQLLQFDAVSRPNASEDNTRRPDYFL
ncbi:serine/threonine-protein phosphatase 2A catalytic subunit beta isoform-like [Symsagittifera roscoffensis]|uniref:serine/threonine-protein phosphatase 2A catalytic subunit beta isoform-like n=1 Tax=Symsagittifera roscoffensis TaxID=84072 RepID=UPI00307C1F3E